VFLIYAFHRLKYVSALLIYIFSRH